MKRYLKGLVGLLPVLASFGIQLLVMAIVAIGYVVIVVFQTIMEKGAARSVTTAEFWNKLSNGMSDNIVLLISIIASIVCGVVFFFWYRHEIRGEVRGKWNEFFTKKYIPLFILLGIGFQFLVGGIMGLIYPFFTEVFDDYAEMMGILSNGNVIIVFIETVLVAPVVEELTFRGMVLHKTNKYLPFLGANIIQAVLFGISHLNIIQGIYAAFFGFILGLVYLKFKTIFAPIFLHMLFNGSSYFMELLPYTNLIYVILLIVGSVIMVVVLKMMMPLKKEEEQISF